jgi:hypothetical protein
MSRSGRAALALGAITLLMAGCGSSDDNDKALSKSDYLSQGNAICKKGNDTINAAGQKLGESATKAQQTAFVTDTIVPAVETELKDLRALNAPEADADKLSSLYDQADAALDKIKATPALALAGDPFAAVNAKATAYGLTECGSSD